MSQATQWTDDYESIYPSPGLNEVQNMPTYFEVYVSFSHSSNALLLLYINVCQDGRTKLKCTNTNRKNALVTAVREHKKT